MEPATVMHTKIFAGMAGALAATMASGLIVIDDAHACAETVFGTMMVAGAFLAFAGMAYQCFRRQR